MPQHNFSLSSCLTITSGTRPNLHVHLARGEHTCIVWYILPVPRRNILCIFKLIYGVGLRAVRKLFMEINPTWSNRPSDAAAFDRGKMKLNKEEEVIFNNGNVTEWDFSLVTTVLLYSKVCAFEISKRPGYDIALRELKNVRNKLLGHPSSEQMSDDHFNSFWPLLSTHFVTLGADQTEIAEIKLQSGTYIVTNKSVVVNVADACITRSDHSPLYWPTRLFTLIDITSHHWTNAQTGHYKIQPEGGIGNFNKVK